MNEIEATTRPSLWWISYFGALIILVLIPIVNYLIIKASHFSGPDQAVRYFGLLAINLLMVIVPIWFLVGLSRTRIKHPDSENTPEKV